MARTELRGDQIKDQTIDTVDIADLAITDAKVAAANIDGTTSTPSMRTLGTGSQQACAGNDSRLSDARTPVGTALTSGKLWVGNGSNLAAAVAMSGEATISDAGVVSLGNAATATALQTSRTINGVSFDGTADITIPATLRSRRNLLHNTDFYNFRASPGLSMSSAQMTCDRWYFNKVGSGTAAIYGKPDFGVTPAMTNDYFSVNSYLMSIATNQATTASGSLYVISQAIEYYDSSVISKSPSTVSFWSKSSTTGKLTVAIGRDTANRVYLHDIQHAAVNTWEKFSFTVPADSTTTWGVLRLSFCLGAGTTYQSSSVDSWITSGPLRSNVAVNLSETASANWSIYQPQLEIGSIATAYEGTPIRDEQVRCLRFFNNVDSAQSSGIDGQHYNTTACRMTFRFPVPMRAAPTVTITSAVNDVIGGGNTTYSTVSTPATTAFFARWDMSGGSPARNLYQHAVFVGTATCDADLV